MTKLEEQNWDTLIEPKTGWLDIHLRELYSYKDLIFLFVKRDFVTYYKQTILGPLWYIIQPLVNTFVYTIIFGKVAPTTIPSTFAVNAQFKNNWYRCCFFPILISISYDNLASGALI